jgi:recombination DNA repair RAD52 pathway protein
MSYLKGQLAVVKANNIFGYGNWGYQLASGVEVIDTETKNRNDNVIYRVRVAVTLTVRGCMPITELGDCEAQGTGPAAMSMAEKGAVTDGLKRCLKNFGPCFGLDLYFKTPPAQTSSQPTTQPQRQQPATQAMRPAVTQLAPQTINRTAPAPSQPQAAKSAQAVAPAPRPVTQNGSTGAPPIPAPVATLEKPNCPEHGTGSLKIRMVTGENGPQRMMVCLEMFCSYMVAV